MRKLVLLAICLTAPSLNFAQGCAYSKDYDFTVDAAALENLRMDVGAGSLNVSGDATSSEVRIDARACASSNRRLDELDLTHRVQGSELIVRTELNRRRGFLSWLNFGNSRIDIEVTMPSALNLQLEDGSGSIEIDGITDVAIDDGSGTIRLNNIAGNATIDDGSGAISVTDVRGRVTISDGSGPITVRNSYEVLIHDDGSGGIDIANIESNVNIQSDGSGSISIRDVAGDVDIGESGSGSVNVSGVAGNYRNHD